MVQSSLLTIYIIHTRVPVRIYTAIVKKSNRLWEKIGSYCYIFCLLIFRCWLNHKFSGQTLLKKDSSIWLCTCHFRSNRNRKYKPIPAKSWYFGLIFSNELFVQFNNPVLLHKILFLGWNISFIFFLSHWNEINYHCSRRQFFNQAWFRNPKKCHIITEQGSQAKMMKRTTL